GAAQADRRVQVSKQSAATLASTNGYQAADRTALETKQNLQNRLGDIIKSDLPIEQTKEAYDALETELNKGIEKIQGQLRTAAEEMKKAGFSDEEIKKAVDGSALTEDIAG
ncbi:hypothetical protein, partial [Mesorhizobium sp. M1C.F.Ca.ET.193.01.1.1]